ncbi:MAG: glutamate--cysteine ligase [Nocardioidaceae bacterium]|nr:glutamate--cysteine ligase [Nocardioidaceae bacterium]
MEPRTVGVEEELLVVDLTDGTPQPLGQPVVESAGRAGPQASGQGGVEKELKREQVELNSEPSTDLAAIGADLTRLRRRLCDAATDHGLALAALGTSPVPVEATPTRNLRYERINSEYGLTTRELLVNGCHVHVSVTSRAEAVGVLDRIRPWLATISALTCNSPYWQGVDSGYASYRHRVWSRMPSAGPTELFGDVAGYDRAIAQMVSCGAAMDDGMIYLDARVSRDYPTVELRVADVCTAVDHAVLVAGLGRGLVETAARELADGVAPAPVRVEVLRGAAWRAARTGVSGDLVDTLSAGTAPAAELVERLVAHVEPALRHYGDLDTVWRTARDVLDHGTGADQQRDAYARSGGDLVAVVRDTAARTTADR